MPRARVAPGGTGPALYRERDRRRPGRPGAALRDGLPSGCSLRYDEIDPDIFGEELERPRYAEVERIAAIGAVIRKRA